MHDDAIHAVHDDVRVIEDAGDDFEILRRS
jgi:hypothetical protein